MTLSDSPIYSDKDMTLNCKDGRKVTHSRPLKGHTRPYPHDIATLPLTYQYDCTSIPDSQKAVVTPRDIPSERIIRYEVEY